MGARSYLIDMTVKLAVIIYIYAEIFNLFHSSQVFRTKRKYNIIITTFLLSGKVRDQATRHSELSVHKQQHCTNNNI